MHLHVFLHRALRCFSTQTIQSSSKRWRVSSLGRVCSLNGTVSYGWLSPSGYRYVCIHNQPWPVHRVVMITFNGAPAWEKAWQVHHIDGDPSNNCLTNLEYVTPSQNRRYSQKSLLRKSNAPARSKPVLSRLVASNEWTSHASIAEAARKLGVAASTIFKSCKTNLPAKGYVFKFQDSSNTSPPWEEWRPMVDPRSGAEVCGRMVSSLGRISSKYGIISRGHLNRTGYHETGLSVNGQYRTMHVHRLVAAAFIGLPQTGHRIHVNHKDLNKANNAVNNLEYLTPSENRSHFLAHSSPKRNTGLKPVWSKAYSVDEPWTWHASILNAAKELGLNRGSISSCAHGKIGRVGKYEFQFADLQESHLLPGEEWRDIDIWALQQDRQCRRWSAFGYAVCYWFWRIT